MQQYPVEVDCFIAERFDILGLLSAASAGNLITGTQVSGIRSQEGASTCLY